MLSKEVAHAAYLGSWLTVGIQDLRLPYISALLDLIARRSSGLGRAVSLPLRQSPAPPVFADLWHDLQHGPMLRHPQEPRNGLESAATPSRNNGPWRLSGCLFFCH